MKEDAEELYKRISPDSLPIETVGWLLYVLSDDSQNLQRSRTADELMLYISTFANINDTNNSATFSSYYPEPIRPIVFHTPNRTGAILLEAILHADPTSALCGKVARGLVYARANCKWLNAQVTSWALLALSQYLQGLG